ncbi:MAG: (2Fe-2S)-binding protein [Pseudomonadota bacterium]
MSTINLKINGAEVSATVEPRTHLADFLREQQRLTGTHLGCEHGHCGACTVLLNGEPVRSCLTLAVSCQGAMVETIEGMEDDDTMQSLRDAFKSEHALQCGFCSPGMLMTARDLVRRRRACDDQQLREALAGNWCRCTGYLGIVRAVRRVLDANS